MHYQSLCYGELGMLEEDTLLKGLRYCPEVVEFQKNKYIYIIFINVSRYSLAHSFQ
jgi:hypothetical protein